MIVLPDMAPEQLIEGHAEGTMPPEYVGGLGEAGVRALEEFVTSGGTLLAFNRAAMLPIQRFGLPVVNAVADVERSEFYVPGSIVRLNLVRNHWLAAGMAIRNAAWFERGAAFEVGPDGQDRVEIVGRFGAARDLLLSGWITGAERLAGRGALAVVKHGQGRVILFGFKPQYRGQTVATFPLIFNALKRSLEDSEATEAAEPGRRRGDS